jgi:REP element-mobilizing transposase RayT
MREDRHRGSHRLRLGRVSIPGTCYHLRFSTHRRRPVFGEFHAARAVVRSLQEADRRAHASTLCFVVMPDHVHWLCVLGPRIRLAALVGGVKARVTRELRVDGPLWQDGFFDRALRAEEDLAAAARYIVANPLRAGIAGSVRAYPHWDAVWL